MVTGGGDGTGSGGGAGATSVGRGSSGRWPRLLSELVEASGTQKQKCLKIIPLDSRTPEHRDGGNDKQRRDKKKTLYSAGHVSRFGDVCILEDTTGPIKIKQLQAAT